MNKILDIAPNIENYFSKTDRKLFYSTLIVFLICFSFRMFSYMMVHDSTGWLYMPEGQINWEIMLGRYMGAFFYNIRGYSCAPVIVALWLLAACYFMGYFFIRLFNIENSKLAILLPVFFVSNIVHINLFGIFVDCADQYAIGELLSFIAVYLLAKNEVKSFILAIILEFVSIGIFQVNVQVYGVLVVLYCIHCFVKGITTKEIFKFVGKSVLLLSASVAIYWIGLKLVQSHYHLEFDKTDSYNSLAHTFYFLDQNLWSLLVDTYNNFYTESISSIRYMISKTKWLIIVTWFFVVLGAVYAVRKEKLSRIFLVAVFFVAIPFVANVAYFISVKNTYLHCKFSYVLPLAFSIVVYSYLDCVKLKLVNACKKILCVVVVLIGYYSCLTSNTLYVQLDRDFFTTGHMYSKILNDLYNNDDFDFKNSKVMFCGAANFNQNTTQLFSRGGFTKGYFDFFIAGYSSFNTYTTTYEGTISGFINEFMRQRLNYLPYSEELSKAVDIDSMPAYPIKGYIKKVNDVFFVKLSELH